MKGTTVIKNLGTIILKDICLGDGQIEVHLPIDDVSDSLNKIMDDCKEDFKKKNKLTSDEGIYFDIRVVFSCGNFVSDAEKRNGDFKLLIIVWNDSADEFYEDIPVSFDTEDSKKIKKIIWNEIGKVFFNL